MSTVLVLSCSQCSITVAVDSIIRDPIECQDTVTSLINPYVKILITLQVGLVRVLLAGRPRLLLFHLRVPYLLDLFPDWLVLLLNEEDEVKGGGRNKEGKLIQDEVVLSSSGSIN